MFKGLFFLLLVFLIRASFSKNDEKHVSKKININCIKLVSMCSLGTVLWLTLVPAGHLCSFNGVTVEIYLPHFCSPEVCRSKLKQLNFPIALSVILAFQN